MTAVVTLAGFIALALAVIALAGFVFNLFDRAKKSENRMTTLETELRSHLRWHNTPERGGDA